MIPTGRIVETDGLGASLMPVVCSWCKRDMGAKVCEPAMAGKTSHGICPTCRDTIFGALRVPPGAGNEAASLPKLSTTEPSAAAEATGTADSAGVMNPPKVVEHARARPAASFTLFYWPEPPHAAVAYIDRLIKSIATGRRIDE